MLQVQQPAQGSQWDVDRLPDGGGGENRDALGRGGEQASKVEAGECPETSQLSSTYHGVIKVRPSIESTVRPLNDNLRSLAKRGELLPIYNKAKEKTMELEKVKKEKKAAAKA